MRCTANALNWKLIIESCAGMGKCASLGLVMVKLSCGHYPINFLTKGGHR